MQYHYFKFVYSYNNLQYTGTLIKQAVCTAPQPLTTQSQKREIFFIDKVKVK